MKKYSWREVAFLVTWGLYFTLILLPEDHGASKRIFTLMVILAIVIHRHYRSPMVEGLHIKVAMWALIAYLLINFISTIIPNEVLSLQFSDRHDTPLYAALITISVLLAARSHRMVEHLTLVLLAVFGIYFAVELLATPWWKSLSPGSRFSGSTTHPNRLGMTLLVLPSICLGALGIVRRRAGRIALVAGAAIFTFFLFLTKSRSCLLVFGLISLPLSVLMYGVWRPLRTRILIVVILMALIVPMSSYVWVTHATEERNSMHSIYGRLEAWQASISLAFDGPWYRTLIGHGKYRQGFKKLADHYGLNSRNYPGEPVHAHNSYLQALVESGILGLASLIMFAGSILFGLISGYRKPDQNLEMTGIMLVSIITILAIGFLDYNLHSLSGRVHYGVIALAAATVSQKVSMERSYDQ